MHCIQSKCYNYCTVMFVIILNFGANFQRQFIIFTSKTSKLSWRRFWQKFVHTISKWKTYNCKLNLSPTIFCLWSKNNRCLFKRLFQVKNNGVFLFTTSFFVSEIFTFSYYSNEENDDVTKVVPLEHLLNQEYL